MGFKKKFLLNSRGQSTVEYILLFAVVISIVTAVFKSERFKKLLGADGDFATIYKSEIEFSYRNTFPGRVPFAEPNYRNNEQPSYNKTFFIARDQYPQ